MNRSRLALPVVALFVLTIVSGCTLSEKSKTVLPTVTSIPVATVVPTTVPTVVAELHTIDGDLLIQPGYHYEGFDDQTCVSGCGQDGAPCTGMGPYSDLRTGTQITVRDDGGKLIAVGALELGSLELWPEAIYWGRCRLPLEISDVPDALFYTISVGSRPGITFTHAQLVSTNWRVSLTLGEPDW